MHTRLAELKPSYRIIHFIYSDQNTIVATIEKMTVLTEHKQYLIMDLSFGSLKRNPMNFCGTKHIGRIF
jgi:hypothetical protein